METHAAIRFNRIYCVLNYQNLVHVFHQVSPTAHAPL